VISKPLEQPDTHTVYMLLKQTGTYLTPVSSSTSITNNIGVGFFWTKEEAEQHRTMEILRLTSTDDSNLLIYAFEIPNVAKKK
jgi:hypothetical protein